MTRAIETIQRPTQRLYTVKDAMVYLGHTENGVRELIWSGELPVVKRSGRGSKQYIDVRDMDTWIEKNKARLL